LSKKGIRAKLVLAGEGDLVKRLTMLALKLGVEKQIKLTGFVSETQKRFLIKHTDVYLFPTRWRMEGFGIAPLEAMSFGVPVVASNKGPVPEVVGDAGLLINPNPEKVAVAIERLLKDKKLYRKLSHNGPLRVRRYFDIEDTSKSYLRVFYGL
jgi:glycosyltransferase involved in cell wall biosynthesis